MQKSKAETLSPTREENFGTSSGPAVGARPGTAMRDETYTKTHLLMEAVVDRENMFKALKRVKRNGGSAGVDGKTTDDLDDLLKSHWPKIKVKLLNDEYLPNAVRVVEIPKPNGGTRMLGIPTVMDRLIQQAINQVLTPIFDPSFSENSFGFRPNRSAHQALLQAKKFVDEGRNIVVDIDLEKFFDRVNHDMLMSRVAKKVYDKRVLRLIRKYLQAGLMKDGLVNSPTEGTPQGGPLSPLLSNILLDDLDKELEKRGHRFCRYADDCNIYVKTKQAGDRVLQSVTKFLETKLKLKVNKEKSTVARPAKRKFLGYTVFLFKGARLKPAIQSIKRLKLKLCDLFRKGRGRNLGRFIKEDLNPVLTGWINYYKLSEVKVIFEDLDSWLTRKLRCLLWRQWKKTRNRVDRLVARGIGKERSIESATNGHGPWWNSDASHMNQAFPTTYFDQMKLVSLLEKHMRFRLELSL